MHWYWKVRIYAPDGNYAFAEIKTERTLDAIDAVQDAYLALTGCKMLLEGMSDIPFKKDGGGLDGFHLLWRAI